MRFKAIIVAALLSLAGASTAQTPPTQNPQAAAHVARARALAGDDFANSLFLCESNARILEVYERGHATWPPPTRAFDNLYYIGNEFVGVWVLRTSAGLILIDAGESAQDVADRILPGLRQLGLDPADIRYVLVTHAHWDHYGGAKYLQEQLGARIGLTAPDWDLLDRMPVGDVGRNPNRPEDRADRPPPRRDLVIRDGQRLRLGDTTITLYVTPGHTPGTLSAIIPVREGRRTYRLSLLGGTAFPPQLELTDRTGGLIAFQASVERLSRISRRAGAVGLINTHIFVDGSTARLTAARARMPGQANPFLLGTDAVTRYYEMFGECLQAAAARVAAR